MLCRLRNKQRIPLLIKIDNHYLSVSAEQRLVWELESDKRAILQHANSPICLFKKQIN